MSYGAEWVAMHIRWLAIFGLMVFAATGVAGAVAGLSPLSAAGVAGAATLVTLLLSVGHARDQSAAVRDIATAMRRLGAGEFDLRVYAGGSAALTGLARAVNAAAAELSARFAHLETDRRQLRAILGGMVEGVVLLDASQGVLFANERAVQLLELPPAAIGKKFWEVVRHRRLQQIVTSALGVDTAVREEVDWHGPTPRALAACVARLGGSASGGAVLVMHDVTDLRRLERVRREFVANVSHELKTPLTVIKVNVETLQAGAANEPGLRAEFLEQIQIEADRLHALIQDLLSLARIESGAESLEMTDVLLEPLVQSGIERHRSRAEAHRQTLESHGPSNGLVAARADAEALETILDNLIDNALKYTPDGGRIAVRWYRSDGQAIMEVEDNGIGIPASDQAHVFERFYRVDKARSRELGGTGLGLSIVKHLTQAMQGSVSVESAPGQGSRFSIALPAVPS